MLVFFFGGGKGGDCLFVVGLVVFLVCILDGFPAISLGFPKDNLLCLGNSAGQRYFPYILDGVCAFGLLGKTYERNFKDSLSFQDAIVFKANVHPPFNFYIVVLYYTDTTTS